MLEANAGELAISKTDGSGKHLVCKDSTILAANNDRFVHPKVWQHKQQVLGVVENAHHTDFVVLVPDTSI